MKEKMLKYGDDIVVLIERQKAKEENYIKCRSIFSQLLYSEKHVRS